MDANVFDLWGDPMPANYGKKGAPGHVATSENRNKVMVLLAMGWTNARIAGALSISQPTLRLHYSSELKLRKAALDKLKATRFAMLFTSMAKGVIGAHREFDRLAEKEFMAGMSARVNKPKKGENNTVAALGKKETQKAEAPKAHGGTRFADLVEQTSH